MAFGTPIDVTSPAATDLVSAGDDAIRATREGFRERLDVDHDFGEDTAGDTINDSTAGDMVGEHKKVTLQERASHETAPEDTIVLYSRDVSGTSRLYAVSNSESAIQLTTGDNKLRGGAIEDGGVGATQLAADAVETAKIKDGEVTAAKLAADAVETAKIKNENVTAAKDALTAYKGSDVQRIAVMRSVYTYWAGNGVDDRTIELFASGIIRHFVIHCTDGSAIEGIVYGSTAGDDLSTRLWRQASGAVLTASAVAYVHTNNYQLRVMDHAYANASGEDYYCFAVGAMAEV